MVCGDYPDVRCGRITHAMRTIGWEHDVVTRAYPPQFEDIYTNIDWHPFRSMLTEAAARTDGELLHVHGELHHFFPVLDVKKDGRPVILNVHDLCCARKHSILDVTEEESLAAADAHVWVTEEQRDFAKRMNLPVDKPYCIIPNLASSRHMVEKPVLPHIGGICYEGSIDPRGQKGNDRDFSDVADALGDDFHIYPGGTAPDYGVTHETELDFHCLLHRLSQHDWGLAGYPEPLDSVVHGDPTKAYEYLMAGIPVIAMNSPTLIPLIEEGMGVWADSIEELPKVLSLDIRAYKERVVANRRRFTLERVIEPLAALYEEVLS